MVEFALVLPMLLILLLGIADFGRLFSAGITIEAAARNAAEVGAIERLRNRPDPDPLVCDAACLDTYYANLHELVAKVACSETRLLPNSTFVPADDPVSPAVEVARTCPDRTDSTGLVVRTAMPIIRVCVHDGVDPRCGQPIANFPYAIPADPDTGASLCPRVTEMANNPDNSSGGELLSHSVEVAVCYHFTTLFNLHLSLGLGFAINLGDVWIQRQRVFVLDCPPPPQPPAVWSC